jgi:hypothetical protein
MWKPAEVLAYLGLGINALFTSRHPGKRWIDNTQHHVLMADLLATMFPDALFLNLQRDGRRVVHSMVHFLDRFPAERRTDLFANKKIPPWASSFQDACQHWRTFVEAGKSFAVKRPRRCRTISNENLVAKPDAEFTAIFSFFRFRRNQGPSTSIEHIESIPAFPKASRNLLPTETTEGKTNANRLWNRLPIRTKSLGRNGPPSKKPSSRAKQG